MKTLRTLLVTLALVALTAGVSVTAAVAADPDEPKAFPTITERLPTDE